MAATRPAGRGQGQLAGLELEPSLAIERDPSLAGLTSRQA
jgi:hypothetical protein